MIAICQLKIRTALGLIDPHKRMEKLSFLNSYLHLNSHRIKIESQMTNFLQAGYFYIGVQSLDDTAVVSSVTLV
ncbi:unnamed protein product [Larinioides sclopetarius]|uniref:Uncharacterized protein n=1 Tax=Larinioides sclopetarius TaxID=280406 RepID=A0AAV1ZAV3_9ARAC